MSPVAFEPAFDLPTLGEASSIAARTVLAAALGGLLGYERELVGKAAGLRTHMLVALGSAVFVLGAREAGTAVADVSRVVQGVATGIGFVGAGAMLKSTDPREVKGLTTATSIWLTSPVEMAVGTGALWLPALAAAMAVAILSALRAFERRRPR